MYAGGRSRARALAAPRSAREPARVSSRPFPRCRAARQAGHGLARIPWLEAQSFDPSARPVRQAASRTASTAGTARGARLSVARGDLRRPRRRAARGARLVVASSASPPARSATGCARLARSRARRRSHRDVAAAAAHPDGGAAAHGHEPARDRDPLERRRADRRRRLDGRRHPWRRARAGAHRPRSSSPSAARAPTRRSRSPSASSCSSARSPARSTAPCCSWRRRSTIPCRPSALCAGGLRLPGDSLQALSPAVESPRKPLVVADRVQIGVVPGQAREARLQRDRLAAGGRARRRARPSRLSAHARL